MGIDTVRENALIRFNKGHTGPTGLINIQIKAVPPGKSTMVLSTNPGGKEVCLGYTLMNYIF